ncbi:hypothetical protein BSIN_3457 [Burkholderia singularis]|uniref:Uncharacterized protein n=1 Tax=Burkholderia singularis TaxID=1503053 RepID=A0A238HBU6_9BURK|nr:hypothetical protein BSIN_3457 [Burkholderia singularis]
MKHNIAATLVILVGNTCNTVLQTIQHPSTDSTGRIPGSISWQ